MSILAFDPSKTCTGWAVLEDDGTPDGRLVEAGTIKHDSAHGCSPHMWIGDIQREVVGLHARVRSPVVAIETPAETGKAWGGYRNRSVLSIPVYGMAVGAVVAAINTIEWDGLKAVICVPVDEWAGRMPTGGDHKPHRVRMAAMLYEREQESFGTKTDAGNIADAVLLARWVLLNKVRRAVA